MSLAGFVVVLAAEERLQHHVHTSTVVYDMTDISVGDASLLELYSTRFDGSEIVLPCGKWRLVGVLHIASRCVGWSSCSFGSGVPRLPMCASPQTIPSTEANTHMGSVHENAQRVWVDVEVYRIQSR